MSDEIPEVTDWRDSLPENLRDAPYFKNAESPEQVRSDLDGAAFWQGNSILKPGAEASDEAKANNQAKLRELYPDLVNVDAEDIYTRLGKPEEATKYATPENLSIGADELIQLKQIAFNANLTTSQFKDQITALDAARRTGAEVNQSAMDEQSAALRSEWGEATDSRKGVVGRFMKADETTPAGLVKAHEDGTLSPAEYKWLYSLAVSGDEQPEVSSQGKGDQPAMSVIEGVEKAQDIRSRMFKMKTSDPLYSHLTNQLLEADKAAAAGG
jgi:hypothetical protein